MINFRVLALTVLFTSLIIAPAYAWRDGCNTFHRESKRSQQVERLKQRLDLTPQQQQEFEEIQTAHREGTVLLRKELRKNKEAMRGILDAENLDEPRLRELTREQADRRAEIMVAKHATRAKINQLLTPEQQQKHKELWQERSPNMSHHRDKKRRTADAESQ